MGFGGGGQGQLGAHIHSNAAGQGGNLTQGSLLSINSDTPTLLHQLMPIGSMIMWGGTRATIPDRFIECDGASLLRAGVFADLFAVIGVQFGSVDGTHFNAPDMDEEFARGSPNASDSGGTGGANTVTLTANESGLRSHTHAIRVGVNSGGASHAAGPTTNDLTSGSAGPLAAIDAHENRPSFLEGVYIIRF